MNLGVRIISWALAGVLSATTLHIALSPGPSNERAFQGTLAKLLPGPDQLGGWTDASSALAETPELREKVVRILRFDEVICRTYQNGRQRVSLYAAYWLPGKVPFADVHEHTPDTCWVTNGWHPKAKQDGVHMRDVDGGLLLAARQRVFEFGGQDEHVVFWHLVNGSVANAPLSNAAPNRYLSTFLRRQPRYEQLFVRVSSNMPIDEIWATPPMNEILRRFSFLKDTGTDTWKSF